MILKEVYCNPDLLQKYSTMLMPRIIIHIFMFQPEQASNVIVLMLHREIKFCFLFEQKVWINKK